MPAEDVRVLDLCTGIGGMGLHIPHKTVLYVECDTLCREILLMRMAEGHIDKAPIATDVATLDTQALRRAGITHIFAGFPCQDISTMGQRRGIAPGTRSGLLLSILSIARRLRVPWLYLENVRAILDPRMWDSLVRLVDGHGYDMAWTLESAAGMGAPHVRTRWFALCRRRRDPQATAGLIDNPREHNHPSGMMMRGTMRSLALPTTRPPRPLLVRLCAGKFEDRAWRMLPPNRKCISYWATPRTSGAGSCNRLTMRSSCELGTQLRYATTTPKGQTYSQRTGIVACPEFVEWMMGFPEGWTNPSASVTRRRFLATRKAHEHWDASREPAVRTVVGCEVPRVHARHRCLGNACVPQCSAKAWITLQEVWSQTPHKRNQLGQEKTTKRKRTSS